MSVPTLQWLDPPRGPAVALLDQTRLPAEEKVFTCENVPELVDAIRRLVIRGAPVLGVAGAFGVALAACRGDDVAAAARLLGEARPTAVNLAWGTRRALAAYQAALGRAVGAETSKTKIRNDWRLVPPSTRRGPSRLMTPPPARRWPGMASA